MMTLIAEEVADRVAEADGKWQIGPFLSRVIEQRQRLLHENGKVFLLLMDQQGRVIYKPRVLPPELLQSRVLPDDGERVGKVKLRNGDSIYFVGRTIERNESSYGTVMLFSPEIDKPPNRDQLRFPLIMLISLGLLGWAVIYLLTRKLAQPIKNVADAAKQIVAGNYDIQLEHHAREKEIGELIDSFREMVDRLRLLEQMRTELLAGVTHELKTPVTSISGLIQAVKDEVVTGEEAREFLDICSKETSRLQKMVEDLLDFNSFAVGEIKVRKEAQNMNRLIQEIAFQWKLAQEEHPVTLRTHVPDEPISAITDAGRLQQILYNLFNNALQAAGKSVQIDVFLTVQEEKVRIDVKDNGPGIPVEEQPLIFERFYRGKEKKQHVRGLGLGLPFSKLIARALGGDLLLAQSTSDGTTFTLLIPQNC